MSAAAPLSQVCSACGRDDADEPLEEAILVVAVSGQHVAHRAVASGDDWIVSAADMRELRAAVAAWQKAGHVWSLTSSNPNREK